ncbi:hypothetical protein K504DRAFT_382818, partial [Pleomassaria siparia CBS 279.74]
WSWVLLVVNLLATAASVGVLAYLSGLQGNEKTWQSAADATTAGQRFTRETWVCQMNKFFPAEKDWAGPACGLAVLECVLNLFTESHSVLVILSTCILVRVRGGIKWLAGGNGRYAGFDDVVEMQARVLQQQPPKNGVSNNGETFYQ